ncbi:MAG: glycoside hydrolase family 16 protein [Burkholderiales bacterium]|nr:glycoside hydrolase family 16 protein [Burkholderiales bacterium]
MNLATTLRALLCAPSLGLLVLIGGCGDGGQTPTEDASAVLEPPAAAAAAPDAPDDPPAAEPAAEKLAPELITNGTFALGLSHWATRNAVLAASPLRPGQQLLAVDGSATQSIPAGRLVAGTSYTLRVMARVTSAAAPAQLSMRFRRPTSEIIRSHTATAGIATYFRSYRIDFTAPPYADMGEVTVSAGGARVLVDSVSLTPREPIAQTEPVLNLVGSHVPPGYVLAFNDEFNGPELNRSKWFTRYIYGGGTTDRLNDEKQRYRDNRNHGIAGGILSLTARKATPDDPNGIYYESGMIRSDWTTRYGYFEARVKMPGGIGMWPAFWLTSDVSPAGVLSWPPEIDIFEFVNNGVEDRTHMLHSGVVSPSGTTSLLSYTDPAFNTRWTYYAAPFKFNEGWHTVGAEWDASSVTMYVDGRKIYTRSYRWNYPDGTLAAPAHILLNLAVGGSWAGRYGIDDAALPQSLQIDWVRAYRRAL